MKDIKIATIGEVLKPLYAQLQAKRKGRRDLQEAWARAVDKKTLRHAHIKSLQKGVASVYVDSPAWLYQLYTQEAKILEGLKTHLGGKVRKVRFKIGV